MTCDDLDPAGKILVFTISILPSMPLHVSEVMPIREGSDTVVSDGITDSQYGPQVVKPNRTRRAISHWNG